MMAAADELPRIYAARFNEPFASFVKSSRTQYGKLSALKQSFVA